MMNYATVSKILKSHLFKQILFYSLFCFVLWLFHLMVISIITFFHFLLNHNIRTVGDWISDRGWQIIILSKVLIFYLATLFINLKLSKNLSWSSLTRDHFQNIRSKLHVSLMFLVLGAMITGGMGSNSSFIFSLFRTLLIMLGIFIFFTVDYMVIYILDHLYPLRRRSYKILKTFIFPVLFYLFSSMTFKYEQNISANLFCFFLLLMYLGEWRRKNWTYPLLGLFVFIIPSYVLFGADPVWGVLHSPFVITGLTSFKYTLALVGVSIGYLEYDRQKKVEYIYRD